MVSKPVSTSVESLFGTNEDRLPVNWLEEEADTTTNGSIYHRFVGTYDKHCPPKTKTYTRQLMIAYVESKDEWRAVEGGRDGEVIAIGTKESVVTEAVEWIQDLNETLLDLEQFSLSSE